MNQLFMAILLTVVAIAGSYFIGKRMSEQTSGMVAAGLGILGAYGWKIYLGMTGSLSMQAIVVMIAGVLICSGMAKLGRKAR